MRTHWGDVKHLCKTCKRWILFLLIGRHLREGVTCPRCHRFAMSAAEAREVAIEREQQEEASCA